MCVEEIGQRTRPAENTLKNTLGLAFVAATVTGVEMIDGPITAAAYVGAGALSLFLSTQTDRKSPVHDMISLPLGGAALVGALPDVVKACVDGQGAVVATAALIAGGVYSGAQALSRSSRKLGWGPLGEFCRGDRGNMRRIQGSRK